MPFPEFPETANYIGLVEENDGMKMEIWEEANGNRSKIRIFVDEQTKGMCL